MMLIDFVGRGVEQRRHLRRSFVWLKARVDSRRWKMRNLISKAIVVGLTALTMPAAVISSTTRASAVMLSDGGSGGGPHPRFVGSFHPGFRPGFGGGFRPGLRPGLLGDFNSGFRPGFVRGWGGYVNGVWVNGWGAYVRQRLLGLSAGL